MERNLSFAELVRLLQSVFGFRDDERGITIFVDLPTERLPDSAGWKDRRRLALEWYAGLQSGLPSLPFGMVNFCAYDNVGSNNNSLPETILLIQQTRRDGLETGDEPVPLRMVLDQSSIVLSMTELSATAPLKLLAKEIGFRGATLPGFSRKMLPALLLDYERIHARVVQIKNRLDRAVAAQIDFTADSISSTLNLDLRFRTAHASGGIIREPGLVANLPSGEAYIVPYEGERAGLPSGSSGVLPVQFGDEIVSFHIAKNRVLEVEGNGPEATVQRKKLADERAYGNIAELGIGVLGEWGVKPVGSTLLDEKLGLHVAFGRSDHFGGATGPRDFVNPENVVHIDWVYSSHLQPRIQVQSALLRYEDGSEEAIITQDRIILPNV